MINQMKIKIKKQLKCKRCGHEWNPRQEEVFVCPGCKSAKWHIEKEEVEDDLRESVK